MEKTPLFIATYPFDPSDGQRWTSYLQWAKISGLVEVVSLDSMLCPRLISNSQLVDEDWKHIVNEDYRLDYFCHLDYLLGRIQGVSRRNVLGLYLNPEGHITSPPATGNFSFIGYDLLENLGGISALTNCGGFPDAFNNDDLNRFALIESFDRASEIRQSLAEHYPNEPHAQCELWAIWRLNE